MPTILTVDEIRQHVETDLPDEAMTRLVEAADQEIIDRLGALASETKTIDGEGLKLLPLPRRASSITSVVERVDETDYTLAANDSELQADGFRLRRAQGSNYPALEWRGQVTVTYVPYGGATGELAMRKKLLADLVRLDCAYQAEASSSVGDASRTALDHAAERNKIFSLALTRNRRMPLA